MKSVIRNLAFLLGLLSTAVATAQPRTSYDIEYLVQFLPVPKQAEVSIKHTPGRGRLVSLRLDMPADRYPDITGEGSVRREGDAIVWTPRRDRASTLRYRVNIDHQRRDGGYDARITRDWVIMRGDDLVPPARIRATRGADSQARLRFLLPRGWTNADTAFPRSRAGDTFVIVNADRAFDRPVGWVIAGEVGTRREQLGATEISVAGPKEDDVRRNDMLAFFNQLVPEFRRAFGDLPSKLLIVSADDPMWRGGLSGPRSLFLHADRPLISENGSSTLVHELTHVLTRIRGADYDDWIAEGLAEFYSIELMHRAGLLSDARRDKAFDWMANHGRKITRLHTNRSSGERTARAVILFRDLDAELRAAGVDDGLDSVTRALIPLREISREELRREVERRLRRPSRVLAAPLLD